MQSSGVKMTITQNDLNTIDFDLNNLSQVIRFRDIYVAGHITTVENNLREKIGAFLKRVAEENPGPDLQRRLQDFERLALDGFKTNLPHGLESSKLSLVWEYLQEKKRYLDGMLASRREGDSKDAVTIDWVISYISNFAQNSYPELVYFLVNPDKFEQKIVKALNDRIDFNLRALRLDLVNKLDELRIYFSTPGFGRSKEHLLERLMHFQKLLESAKTGKNLAEFNNIVSNPPLAFGSYPSRLTGLSYEVLHHFLNQANDEYFTELNTTLNEIKLKLENSSTPSVTAITSSASVGNTGSAHSKTGIFSSWAAAPKPKEVMLLSKALDNIFDYFNSSLRTKKHLACRANHLLALIDLAKMPGNKNAFNAKKADAPAVVQLFGMDTGSYVGIIAALEYDSLHKLFTFDNDPAVCERFREVVKTVEQKAGRAFSSQESGDHWTVVASRAGL